MVVCGDKDANWNTLVFDDLLHQGVSKNATGWGSEKTQHASHSIATWLI
jgi:hypothetical protein